MNFIKNLIVFYNKKVDGLFSSISLRKLFACLLSLVKIEGIYLYDGFRYVFMF